MPDDDAEFLKWFEARVGARWSSYFSMNNTKAYERLGNIIGWTPIINEVMQNHCKVYAVRTDDLLKQIAIGRQVIARRVARTLLGAK